MRLERAGILLSALLGVSAAVSLTGCDKVRQGPPAPFELVVKVESDPGAPLPGAAVVRNGKDVTATGADGKAKLTLNGKEGEAIDFFVRCPPDFLSPTKPIAVRLTRIADKQKLPEYSASCPPTVRKIVVAVRAEGGPNLPVTYLGKQYARTDASGAAHLVFQMHPGDQFELGLDTSQATMLRPQSPTHTFVVQGKDEIQLFDVKFAQDKPKIVYRAPAPVQRGPVRIGPKSTSSFPSF